MNGYFQLLNEESGLYVLLKPPSDGGEPLELTEVTEYFTFKGIVYDKVAFYKEAEELREEPLKIKISQTPGSPEREMVKIWIASDNMSAVARFYAPSNDGAFMEKREIMNDLRHRGIAYGVKEEVVEAFLANREYCRDFVVAEGTEPECGKDANIHYMFNTERKARPTLQEDGSVDFFHLNILNNCRQGDVLARLEKEIPASPGINVRGNLIPAKEIQRRHFQYGKNVEVSEDGLELLASVDGHVALQDGRVLVSDLLELANVDNATGNIEFAGSVQINGNVCENFSIKAGGDIDVKGVVEGSVLEAGGNIIIARGMNGMGKGRLKADGNIVAKFLENTEVSAEGYIQADSILHCKVICKETVSVGGKKGFISGGSVSAAGGIHVKTLGSHMGADTVVEIGVDPAMKRRMVELQQKVLEGNKVLRTSQPILANMKQKMQKGIALTKEQQEYAKNLEVLFEMKSAEVEEATEELDSIQKLVEISKNVSVAVEGDVYAGTRIVIGDVSMVVKENVRYCRFVKDRGDVKMRSL